MESPVPQLIEQILSASNESRQAAEANMKELRQNSGEAFCNNLSAFIVNTGALEDATKQDQASLACILLKKQYLDDRDEEKEMWQLTNDNVVALRNAMMSSINYLTNSKKLLEKKAEIICKCYKKLDTYPEMIQNLVATLRIQDQVSDAEKIKRKQFAMYNFELISEFHLTQELLVQNSDEFLKVFEEQLDDQLIEVKVASMKAIT